MEKQRLTNVRAELMDAAKQIAVTVPLIVGADFLLTVALNAAGVRLPSLGMTGVDTQFIISATSVTAAVNIARNS